MNKQIKKTMSALDNNNIKSMVFRPTMLRYKAKLKKVDSNISQFKNESCHNEINLIKANGILDCHEIEAGGP